MKEPAAIIFGMIGGAFLGVILLAVVAVMLSP